MLFKLLQKVDMDAVHPACLVKIYVPILVVKIVYLLHSFRISCYKATDCCVY